MRVYAVIYTEELLTLQPSVFSVVPETRTVCWFDMTDFSGSDLFVFNIRRRLIAGNPSVKMNSPSFRAEGLRFVTVTHLY